METSTLVTVIGSILGIIVAGGTIVTFWMNFATKIANNKAAADAAATSAGNANIAISGMHIEIDRLKGELVEHRVAVAREYVSKDTLATLESRVIDAINSLGQRLDNLFKQNQGGH